MLNNKSLNLVQRAPHPSHVGHVMSGALLLVQQFSPTESFDWTRGIP